MLASKLCHTGTADDAEVAKQLDFGSEAVAENFGSHLYTDHYTEEARAASAQGSAASPQSLAPVQTTSPQPVTPCFEESDSDSNSIGNVLQLTAIPARPNCRRRAALDSDSDTEQVATPSQQESTSPLLNAPSTSAYDFDASDSGHTSDADAIRARSNLSLSAACGGFVADAQQKSVSSVIVLDTSDEEADLARRRRHNSYLLCRCDWSHIVLLRKLLRHALTSCMTDHAMGLLATEAV